MSELQPTAEVGSSEGPTDDLDAGAARTHRLKIWGWRGLLFYALTTFTLLLIGVIPRNRQVLVVLVAATVLGVGLILLSARLSRSLGPIGMAALILPVAVWGLSLVMVQRPLGFRLALINSMPPSLIYRSTSYSLVRTTSGDGYRCVPRAAVLGSIRVIGTMPTHPMGPPLPVFAVGGDPQPVDLVVRQAPGCYVQYEAPQLIG